MNVNRFFGRYFLALIFTIAPCISSEYTKGSYKVILNKLHSTGGAVGSSYYQGKCLGVIESLSEEDQDLLIDMESKVHMQGTGILKDSPVALQIHEALQKCPWFVKEMESRIKGKGFQSIKTPIEVLQTKIEMLTTHVENILAVLKSDKKLASQLAEREKLSFKR